MAQQLKGTYRSVIFWYIYAMYKNPEERQYIFFKEKYDQLMNEINHRDFTKPAKIDQKLNKKVKEQYSKVIQQLREAKNYVQILLIVKRVLKSNEFQQYITLMNQYEKIFISNIYCKELPKQKYYFSDKFHKRVIKYSCTSILPIWRETRFTLKRGFQYFYTRYQPTQIINQIQTIIEREYPNKLYEAIIGKIQSNLQPQLSSKNKNLFQSIKKIIKFIPLPFATQIQNLTKYLTLNFFQETRQEVKQKKKGQKYINKLVHQVWQLFQKFCQDQISQEEFIQCFSSDQMKIVFQPQVKLEKVRYFFYTTLNKDFQFDWQIYFDKQVVIQQTSLNYLFYRAEYKLQDDEKTSNSETRSIYNYQLMQQYKQKQKQFLLKCLRNNNLKNPYKQCQKSIVFQPYLSKIVFMSFKCTIQTTLIFDPYLLEVIKDSIVFICLMQSRSFKIRSNIGNFNQELTLSIRVLNVKRPLDLFCIY